MRYETRRMRVNDPDASPGWYDADECDELDDCCDTDSARMRDARPITARHPTLLAAHGTPSMSPYTTRQFAAVRARPALPRETLAPPAYAAERSEVSGSPLRDGATVDLPPLPRITRRMPAITGELAVPERRALQHASAELRAFCEAPTGKRPALPRGITLVPGSACVPHSSSGAGRTGGPRRPNWKLSIGAVLLVVTLAGALRILGPGGAGPLGYDGLAAALGQPPAVSSPVGRRIAGAYFPDATMNPWQAGAFSMPMLGGGGAAAPGALAQAPTPVPTATPRPNPTSAPAAPAPPAPAAQAGGVLAAPFTPWPPSNPWMAVPGHTAYRVYDYAGDPYAVAFGQCTWWAQHERQDENLRGIGNARYWASGAAARGYQVGTTPQANATVVFQPYVQGASPVGHVGHVIAVYPDGWFLMSEMNAFGNGGGWGWVSYRYAHAGSGVNFIY